MWIEVGLTWAYCLMQRLDHSYMMRTSDCPSLKRKPSEYMREMYLLVAADGDSGRSLDPRGNLQDDQGGDPARVVVRLSALGLRPAVSIYDLPFLKEQAKRNILGGNAARLFGLDTKPVKKIP